MATRPGYRTPGIYKEDILLETQVELQTGVPAFIGFTQKGTKNTTYKLTLWSQFQEILGLQLSNSYLAYAVRGFFENGGKLCYVVPLDQAIPVVEAFGQSLVALEPLDIIDLVCAPDLVCFPSPQALMMQLKLLEHCDRCGDRFAILDSLPEGDLAGVLDQCQQLQRTNGALYYPWIEVPSLQEVETHLPVPPCGHIAGVYTRSDECNGVHKAPANEVLAGVSNLTIDLNNAQQDRLNPASINCLRAFPGRGIRIWGARTLSSDPAWLYISTRRLFLTAGRWIERNLAEVVYEPNNPKLWARINRELTAYFGNLFQQGALQGRMVEEAFYVKCDAETNPLERRELGQVVTEIGLAPTVPNEFIVVRIIHGPIGSITISGPS